MKLGQIGVGLNIDQNHSSCLQSYIWSLFAQIHMKSGPKVKLCQVEVDSNIAQCHSSNP